MMDLQEKEWFIEAPWGRLAVLAWGDSLAPPVLLCHGLIDTAVSFRPLLRLLPTNFYYIGVDLPGNGRSDPYPPGMMINAYDLVYVIKLLVQHFRWEKFVFIGHSIGALIGKLYNLSYPGKISKVVDLEPTAAYEPYEPDYFATWYHRYYSSYYANYDKVNAPVENGPLYTTEEARDMLKRNRGLTDELADMILERIATKVGDGRVRFTFNQRMKYITVPPFPAKHLQDFYLSLKTPTLAILARSTVKIEYYSLCPISMDETLYPYKNYRVRIVEGNHDVHVIHPERFAPYVSEFLLNGLDGVDRKAKL